MTPTPELLLRHASEVRRLARLLAGDPSSADDLEQQTWLEAMRRPPQSARNLGGWFREVVRNFARQRHRGDERRARRERRAARAEALPSTAVLVARAELHRHVVAAVLALPDPGREIVLLRYFEGRSLDAIARQLGVSVEAARSRLRRALERIRVLLAERYPEARNSAWARLATSWPTLPVGVTIMTTVKAKIAAILVVAAAVTFTVHAVWQDDAAAEVHLDDGLVVAATTESERPPASTRRPRRTAGGIRQTRVANHTLAGRLIGLLPDVPWTTPLRFEMEGRTQRVAVEGGGRFRVDRSLFRTTVVVTADDPRYLPAKREVDALPAGELELEVRAAAVVTGRVLDMVQRPIAAGTIALFPIGASGKPRGGWVSTAETDRAGDFRLRSAFHGAGLLVAMPPAAEGQNRPLLPAAVSVVPVVGEEVRAPALTLQHGYEIRGVVRWADRRPIAGVDVRIESRGDFVLLQTPRGEVPWWPDGTLSIAEASKKSDAAGGFCFDGLGPRPHEVMLGWLGGNPTMLPDARRTVTAPASGVELSVAAARFEIVVRGDDGSIPRSSVGVRHGGFLRRGSTSADGTSKLVLSPGASYAIDVSARGWYPEHFTLSPEEAGDHGKRVVTLRRQATREVELRVSGAERLRFEWRNGKRDRVVRRELDGEDGVFRFADIPTGTWKVRLMTPTSPQHLWESWLPDHEIEVRVPAVGHVRRQVALARGGRLRLRLADDKGVLHGGTCEVIATNGRRFPVVFVVGGKRGYVRGAPGKVLARGVNEALRALPAGDYRVRVRLENGAVVEKVARISPGERTTVEIEVQ